MTNKVTTTKPLNKDHNLQSLWVWRLVGLRLLVKCLESASGLARALPVSATELSESISWMAAITWMIPRTISCCFPVRSFLSESRTANMSELLFPSFLVDIISRFIYSSLFIGAENRRKIGCESKIRGPVVVVVSTARPNEDLQRFQWLSVSNGL